MDRILCLLLLLLSVTITACSPHVPGGGQGAEGELNPTRQRATGAGLCDCPGWSGSQRQLAGDLGVGARHNGLCPCDGIVPHGQGRGRHPQGRGRRGQHHGRRQQRCRGIPSRCRQPGLAKGLLLPL
ncbi:unnamed protein product [Eretmochelys imbricata]